MKPYYLKVDTYEHAVEDLRDLGLTYTDEDSGTEQLQSTSDTVVDWIGDFWDPPNEYDEEGNLVAQGTNKGPHLNIYTRDADVQAALDEPDFTYLEVLPVPATPARVLAR